jgi:hypothetical protein
VGALLPTEPHNEFLELCAVSTSGQLTEEEHKKLEEHLAVCQSCREILQQYEATIGHAIPAIAARETPENLDPGPGWSEEQAEKAFFRRLEQEQKHDPDQVQYRDGNSPGPHRFPPLSSPSTWRHVWMLYAAGILLFITLSFSAYWIGLHRGTSNAKLAPPPPATQVEPALEAQLSDASHERQIAGLQIVHRDKLIADLRRQLAQQSAVVSGLKLAQDRLQNEVNTGDKSRQEFSQQLEAAKSTSQSLQEKLDSLAQQSVQDSARAKTMDAKINDLTSLLQDREAALNEKDELLAHDQDIRELIGARNLYIAEVHDIAGTGETQKPYGRVFYTREKSLIFYAYDLDRQAGLKRASAFQAWGRRGPDREQAVNLGIFYEDNASKKRWILKFDDVKTLAQIDAVFVTVEPNGGSHKPSGKSLLFAYLKTGPNHP